jgi:hypothetical protein
VAPVGDCLVDKVGDEDDLRAPEVVAGPKEDAGSSSSCLSSAMSGTSFPRTMFSSRQLPT